MGHFTSPEEWYKEYLKLLEVMANEVQGAEEDIKKAIRYLSVAASSKSDVLHEPGNRY